MSHTEGRSKTMQTNQPPPSSTSNDDGVQAKAAEAAEQAQQKAQDAVGNVQSKLREQLDQRSSHAATQINEQASDLRSVSEVLRQHGDERPAQVADQLARYADRVGGYLDGKDSHALLSDAEDFGRRQPWAVAAGGVLVGFAASRFLKASSSQRFRARSPVPPPARAYPASAQPRRNVSGESSDWAAPSRPVAPVSPTAGV
jgi:hypothetical protein